MITKQIFNGYWNLPNSNDSITGSLSFDPFAVSKLELLGHLEGGNEFNVLNKEETIHGFTSGGKKITLLSSINSGNSMSFPGIPTTSYKPAYIIIGEHITDYHAAFYNEIEVEIELLTKWIDIWGFLYKDRERNSFKIEYQLHDDIEFDIDNQVKGYFIFEGSSMSNNEEEFISTHKAKLKIKSQSDLTLDKILEYAWHFKKFLTLATQSNTYFKSIHLKSPYVKDTHDGKEYLKQLELLYHQRQLELKTENSNKGYFLFTYLDIEDQFQALITNWYAKKEVMQPIIDTAYESYSNTIMFIETSFLSSIQALEIFHRRLRQNTKDLISKHSTIWKTIIDKLSEDQREYISKFEYAYEPGLTQRLKELIKEFDVSTIKKLLGTHKQTKDFIFKTVVSRNYYTHYDLKAKEQALSGAKLFYTTEKLKALLLVAIFFEIGLNHQSVEDMLTNIEHYKYHFMLRA